MSSVIQSRAYDHKTAAVFCKTNEAFGGLSNMAPGFPLRVNGVHILTSEALYQACRFPNLPDVQRLIFEQKSPMTAKMKSKPYRSQGRKDWDAIRVRVMRWCLRVKLAQNWPTFRELLLSTGELPIVELSMKDPFWGAMPEGDGTLVGQNILGRLLMELREELKKPEAENLKRVEPIAVPDFLLNGQPIQAVDAWKMPPAPVVDPDLFSQDNVLWNASVDEPVDPKPPVASNGHSKHHPVSVLERPSPMQENAVPAEPGTRLVKRLIEVDLPIARISAHARREKSIRHGHISTLHIWWARRPLAACRAVICAALWPDPADPLCPSRFREEAARLITEFASKVVGRGQKIGPVNLEATSSPETFERWKMLANLETPLDLAIAEHQNVLRYALLDFIADFANWDNSTVPAYLETSRALTQVAHESLGGEPGTRPLVVDPFAGGGSIPLEALRVGADAFASDLNPVAVLLNKVVLEYIPKYGQKLADEVRKWGQWIKEQAEKELSEFYPKDEDGATPIAYLWARTIRCEGPGCGAEVPLMRSLWLAKKASKSVALKIVVKEHRLEAGATLNPVAFFQGGTGFQPVAASTHNRESEKEHRLEAGATPNPAVSLVKEHRLEAGATPNPAVSLVKEHRLEASATPNPVASFQGGTGFQPVAASTHNRESEKEHRLEAGATPNPVPSFQGGTGFQPVKVEQLTHRNLPHIQKAGFTYHVIFSTREFHLPEPARQIAFDACLYWNGNKATIHACVVMPDHVHLLLTPTTSPDGTASVNLSEILHSIKSFSANQINRLLGRKGSLWLDESYDRYLRSDTDFAEKFNYIQNNPVKDGLVSKSEDYPFLYLTWPSEHRLEAGATQNQGGPTVHRLEAGATQNQNAPPETPVSQDAPLQKDNLLGGTGFQPVKYVDFEIIQNAKAKEVGEGTVKRGSATCPCCGFTTPVKSVREQLKKRKGGAADARLFCVVTARADLQGRFYRLPTDRDAKSAANATEELVRQSNVHAQALSLVPDEEISLNEIRRISVPIYGMTRWGDLFTPRQALTLSMLCRLVGEAGIALAREHKDGLADAVQTCLALAVGRQTDATSSVCRWHTTREIHTATFGRQAIGMVWDFSEVNSLSEMTGGFSGAVDWVRKVCESNVTTADHAGTIEQASATAHPLPNDIAAAMVTDPPYYDAVPYAHLSDYFFIWLKRSARNIHPGLLSRAGVPKDAEVVVDRPHTLSTSNKTVDVYERELQKAFAEGHRIVSSAGIGLIVFASKTTSSWEAILQAVVDAGWTITGSWPIDTEMETRVSAQGQARLASSVHLVCRPRTGWKPVPPNHEQAGSGANQQSGANQLQSGGDQLQSGGDQLQSGVAPASSRCQDIGDWRTVLTELPVRMHEWMPRLASEGVVGADAIFACLGPALEIFSRYSSVEKANGDPVSLKEYLELVWAAVSKEAISTIFRDADSSGLEPDARLTAMWLWTLGGNAERGVRNAESEEETDAVEEEEEDEAPKSEGKSAGFTLEFDAARKIAQGLGIHLEKSESIVHVKGDKARLLAVGERTKYLFGKATEPTAGTKKTKKKPVQRSLFEEFEEAEVSEGGWKDLQGPPPGSTVLDRLHQAMILFGAQRGELLKRFLVEDGVGKDARFWKLAQSLAALYPTGSEERRWVEGVLARKKGLGL